jgi:hypothetical protein
MAQLWWDLLSWANLTENILKQEEMGQDSGDFLLMDSNKLSVSPLNEPRNINKSKVSLSEKLQKYWITEVIY